MGDMLGLGVGMAAMGAVVPQMGEMMKGFSLGGNAASNSPASDGQSEQTIKCPQCGNILPPNAKFCFE